MAYSSIRLYNFRNLADAEITLGGRVYFLVGANGAGKSSLLESLYLLSYGSSFRERHLQHCQRQPEQPFALAGKLGGQAGRNGPPYFEVQIQYQQGKKDILLDGKRLQDRKELLALAPCIAFVPGDIAYINGSPKDKRQFIDQSISLVDPAYIDLSRSYSHSLAQRNWVLRHRQTALLPTYTQQMAQLGLQIQQRRAEHIGQLSRVFSALFRSVSNLRTEVTLDYQPSWRFAQTETEQPLQACLEQLEQRTERDLQAGSTQSGPHRDLLQFRLHPCPQTSPLDFTKYASTGQLRLAALALKSAQANYRQQHSAGSSILLLDDVLLEMDTVRRQRFLASLPPYQQVFFTLLPDENLSNYPFSDYCVLRIREGKIEE